MQGLQVECKQSVEEVNVLSMAILPGDKFIVLGTKEGLLSLYDLASNSVIQRIQAHQKEVWEISYHTNPESLKGIMLIASASGDRTIKFHTLSRSGNGNDIGL